MYRKWHGLTCRADSRFAPRRRYFVTTSLIGGAQTQNHAWCVSSDVDQIKIIYGHRLMKSRLSCFHCNKKHLQTITRLLNSLTECRADSEFAPSQWETALLCNAVSHWLGANLESACGCKQQLILPVGKPLVCLRWTLAELQKEPQPIMQPCIIHVLTWINTNFKSAENGNP